jgi:proliferating cell nuclear antigen PCNA
MPSNNIKFLFRARTNEGYLFKVLTEILVNNIKTCCFLLNEESISLRMTDNLKKVLIDLKLDSDKFQVYKFAMSQKKMIGLNLQHLYKMLKSVKKKDTVELFIDEDHINDFGIKVIPKDNTRVTTSFIKIQNIQNISINLPTEYKHSHIISSSDYQKMIKDMLNIGNIINIKSTQNTIKFNCIADGIYSKQVEFGVYDDDDDDELLYDDNFYVDQLHKLIKISGLNNKIYVHTSKEQPLFIRCLIGSLGTICIYVKSINQLNS